MILNLDNKGDKIKESELKTKQNQLDLLVKRKYLYDKAEINTPDYIKFLNYKYKLLFKPGYKKVDQKTKLAVKHNNKLMDKREKEFIKHTDYTNFRNSRLSKYK